MTPEVTQYLVLGATIGIAIFILWQTKEAVSAASIVKAVKSAAPLAQELAEVAKMGVMAAEQFKRDGVIKTNDDALKFAINVVKRWVPASRGFTDDDILVAIKSFVPEASAITTQIEQGKPVPVRDPMVQPPPPAQEQGRVG